MQPMNLKQATELFDREAILIGSDNAIPLNRVAEILSDKAADFARRLSKGWNVYSIGNNINLSYLYLSGFYVAVTYANIEAIKNSERSCKA